MRGGGGLQRPEDAIHLYTQADVTYKRAQLVTDIFSGALPTEVGTLADVASPVVLTGVATCQKMTMVAYASRPRVWTPTVSNGDLMILHQGHSGTYGSYSMTVAIQRYLDAGFTVCGMVMPGGVDEVTSGTSTQHNSDAAALSTFYGPVIVAINTLEGAHEHIYMSGLSGGGHTTVMAAALDTRIEKCYPTGGSLPLNMPSSRDHEQYLTGLRVGYLDLYVLGAVPNRRHKQIAYIADDCCFRQTDYNTQLPYAEKVAEIATQLGGDYDLVWKSQATHEFNGTIIDNEVLTEI